MNNSNSDIMSILSYDDQYREDFLYYIEDNYGSDVLKKINESYMDGSYDYSLWHKLTGYSLIVLNDMYNKVYDDMDNVYIGKKRETVTLGFAGDVSLADNFDIMPYYDKRGIGVEGILSKDVVSIMRDFDIMTVNNEFTISDRGTPLNKLYTFRASPGRINIYKEMGVDLVSLANNHIFDYGEDAFLDTLKYLKEAGISFVGAGENIDMARRSFYYIEGGYKISFISSTRAEKNIITPGATSDSAGTFRCYDPTLLIQTINEEKEKSDFVILLIHWGKEDSHEIEKVIRETGRDYIDAGADLIVGSHAHLLQGMEFYNDKLIAYNLGDFIFNREVKDTGMLSVSIKEGELSYKFIPCQQKDFKTSLLFDEEKKGVLNDMDNYSINVSFDDDGNITKR